MAEPAQTTVNLSKRQLKDALMARKEEFLRDLETLSMKRIRRILEKDLGLDESCLDAHKDLIQTLVDKVVLAKDGSDADGAKENQAPAPANAPKQAAQAKAVKAKRKAPQSDDEGDASDEGGQKKRKVSKTAAVKPAKGGRKKSKGSDDEDSDNASESEDEAPKRKRAAPAPAAKGDAGVKKYGKRVEKLREICKDASIKVGPNVYRNRDESGVIEALEALLSKHGLSGSSNSDQIKAVRKRLEKERDLEGIDTSNIIDEGKRPRRAAAQPVNYRLKYAAVGSDDEEEEEEEQQAPKASKPKAKAAKKKEAAAEDEEQEEGNEGEGSDEDAAPRKPKSSGRKAQQVASEGEDEEEEEDGSEEEEEEEASDDDGDDEDDDSEFVDDEDDD